MCLWTLVQVLVYDLISPKLWIESSVNWTRVNKTLWKFKQNTKKIIQENVPSNI